MHSKYNQICRKYAFLCIKYAQNTASHRLQHSKYAYDRHSSRPRAGRGRELWRWHAKNVKKNAQDAKQICKKYAKNMQNMPGLAICSPASDSESPLAKFESESLGPGPGPGPPGCLFFWIQMERLCSFAAAIDKDYQELKVTFRLNTVID